MNIPDLLKKLRYCDQGFPRKSLQAAEEMQEAITPALLDILEDTIGHATDILELDYEGRFFQHIYALYLLAQFQESAAYPLVIQLARLDSDVINDLLDSIITEDFDRILASVCDGDIKPIQLLIEDNAVDEWVRGAALRSLVLLNVAGELEQRDLITYFRYLFENGLKRQSNNVWNSWASSIVNLHRTELLDYVRTAYELGLVDPDYLSYAGSVEVLQKEYPSPDPYWSSHSDYTIDTIASLQGWHCFQPTAGPTVLDVSPVKEPLAIAPEIRGRISEKEIGRNEPCPCRSGKKFKKCCGRVG